MSSYFDEHNCNPLSAEDQSNLYLQMARLLHDMGFESEVLSVLNSESERKPPASKHFIANLPKVNDFNKCDKCCVCLKEFVIDQTVGLECNHKYHINCITPWLQMHNSCPICRYECPTDDQIYEQNKREKLRKESMIRELHDSMFT